MKTRIIILAVLLISTLPLYAQTIMNIHQSNGTVLQIPLNTIDSITYTINNPGQLATLTTLPISNISNTTSTSGGSITNNGGTPVTHKGVVWSINPNPTTANSQSSDGSGTSSFTSNLTNLSSNTTYYVRAYATNSAGTAYGNELSFTTTGGIGSITALNCSLATNNGTLTSGTPASSVISMVPYSGGNGGNFNSFTVNSTGVTGLTATLNSGSFVNGAGSLTFTITGTASTSGTASFELNIGLQNCLLSRTVNEGNIIVSNPGAGITFNGYTYPSVILGNGQEWMAENLRTAFYANGDPILNVTPAIPQWNGMTEGAWCHYNNDNQYENSYGKLYNWFAVDDPRNVCPAGWHVPTDEEWNNLIGYLDPSYNPTISGIQSSTAGGKMKSNSTQFWQIPNTDATNESGFSGLPGGYRFGYNGIFNIIGIKGSWWSTSGISGMAWYRNLNYNDGNVLRNNDYKQTGFSVRCLKD